IMYMIEKNNYGYRLCFSGFIEKDEMSEWKKESEEILANQTGKFSVFVDMRELTSLPADSRIEMEEGQKLFKEKGMERSVVILGSAITTSQFKRIAKSSGIYECERYINSESDENWEKMGKDWIIVGIDPDKVEK
ncbi:hypothetical protein J7M07_07180, partial [bacterium]|nr:hypothetical protein [bacterium]